MADLDLALADSLRESVWNQYFPRDWSFPSWETDTSADLVVVGGGFTGLWAAILAKTQQPGLDVLVVDQDSLGHAASSRNGGFMSASLTHGHAHGAAVWPLELARLVELGRENLSQIKSFISDHAIDADYAEVGKTAVAVSAVQERALRSVYDKSKSLGEDAVLLGQEQMRADIHSPTYWGGVRIRTGSVLFNPVKLLVGMVEVATALGVRFLEMTPVNTITAEGHHRVLRCRQGQIRAGWVILATSAFSPLFSGIRQRVLPIFDHVLATEVLDAQQLLSLGWSESQGVTDLGNQFHYYRKTPDNRILWGGYDANYYFGNDTSPSRELRPASHRLLAQHFFDTFPQLEGVRFEYQWAGLIDSTSRFTPYFSKAMGGRVVSALGFTGLGTGSSRFGAQVALDLLFNPSSELLGLEMVRRKPIPFPPEPFRYPIVQFTRHALVKEDETGHRNWWLRLLDFFKVGFNS